MNFTHANTSITPSNNEGLVGINQFKVFLLSRSIVDSLSDLSNYFTVGQDIDASVAAFSSAIETLKSEIENSNMLHFFISGVKQAAGTTSYIQYGSDKLTTILDDVFTHASSDNYYKFVEIDLNNHFFQVGSLSSAVEVLNGKLLVVHNRFDNFSVAKYIVYDELTKLITGLSDTKPVDSKFIRVSVLMSWDAKVTTIVSGTRYYRIYDESTIPTATDFSNTGIAFTCNNIAKQEISNWSTTRDEAFIFKIGTGVSYDFVNEKQQYSTGIYDNQKPVLISSIDFSNSYYAAPEVYSRV